MIIKKEARIVLSGGIEIKLKYLSRHEKKSGLNHKG